MLADANAVDVGIDLVKLAAKLRRRVRLEIVHVDMARPAPHPEQDDGRIARRLAAFAGSRLEPKVVGEREPAEGQETGFEKVAPRHAVAGSVSRSGDIQHGKSPPGRMLLAYINESVGAS